MEHTDAETLALLAIGEPVTDPVVITHLSECDECRHEIDQLRSTVSVARSSIGETELLQPPARVWQSVRSQLGLAVDLEPSAAAVSTALAPVVSIGAVREQRSSIRRLVVAVAASAAAAALITGAVLGWGAAEPRESGAVIASAQLDALPNWPVASGQATVTERADGERIVQVSLDADVSEGVLREVWLLTENVDGLISLGWLSGSTGEFVVPASIDLAEYSIVDISAEPLDGDPTHSGDSIVRGALDV